MNDPELSELLKEWQVSNTPASLDARILGERKPWWSLLLTSSIRIPMPLAIAIAALLLIMVIALLRRRSTPPPVAGTSVNLADFRPVKDLNVRIIRGHGDAK